jgi:SanA protein
VKRILYTFAAIVLLTIGPFVWFGTSFLLSSSSQDYEVGLVFGAGLRSDGTPSQVLRNRLNRAVQFYRDNKLKKIIVSGDNRESNYNEPLSMQTYLVKEGVKNEDIIMDFGGLRTYDSCWRAKNVFFAEKILLITQSFHLPRAKFLCESVGLKTQYAIAAESNYGLLINGIYREIGASWVAVGEVMSGYEPPIKGDGTEVDLRYTD